MGEFHFLRPYFLLLALLAIYFAWHLWRREKSANAWASVVDSHLLNHLLIDQGQSKRRSLSIIILITWLLAIFALAGPTWQKQAKPIYHVQSANVIVLDASQAMGAADIKPSRLTRAKYKVRDILKQSQEGQVGLVAFSGEPYVVSPLTDDSSTIAALVNEINTDIMPAQGHDIAAALKKAGELIKQAGNKQGEITLITANAASPGAISEAVQLAKAGISTSVLGVGTPSGAPIPTARGFMQDENNQVMVHRLDVSSLQQLAAAGHGKFVQFTQNNADLESLLSSSKLMHEAREESEQTIDLWKDAGRYFVFVVLIITLLAFRKGQIEDID